MAAEDSSEVLPDGWTVQFNALKTGRKVKCYVNSETGQKFFSKDDFMRYIKAQSTQVDWPAKTKSPIGSSSKSNQMHLIEHTNEHPEWLPNGWIVEVKTKKSGSASGKKYKCYIEPLTGCKFYSKPEVFRHLEAMGQKSCTSKQQETFMSMLPANKGSLQYHDAKVKFEKSTMEDLPPGWIKETRIQRKANGIRKDPFYIDPVHGYMFRSRRDVQRYLETGDITTCKILPKKRELDDEDSLSFAAKSQKLEPPATRQQLLVGNGSSDENSVASSEAGFLGERRLKTASILTAVPEATMTEIPSLKIPSNNGAESEKKSNANCLALIMAEASKRNQVNNASADGGGGLLIPEVDKKQEQNHKSGIMRDETDNIQNSLSQSNKKKGLNIPRRSSKRLAGNEPEMVANLVSTVQVISKADTKQEHNSSENGMDEGECYKRKNQNISSNCLDKKRYSTHWPTEQINLIEHEPLVNKVSIVQALPKTIRSPQGESNLVLAVSNVGLGDKTSEEVNDEGKKELLLHASTASSPLLGEPSNKSQKFDTMWPVQPKPKASERSQCGIVSATAGNGPVLTPEVDTMQEQKSLASGSKGSSQARTRNNLSACRNKKALNLPCRSSKRLAGLQPELAANSASSAQALLNAKRSCRSESSLSVGLTPGGLADMASKQIKSRAGRELPHHGLTNVHNSEPLNKNQVSLHSQAASKVQSQMLEVDKTKDEELEPKHMPPFGEFLSDPCIEFAFKTLTGEIPVEIANNAMNSTRAPDVLDERNLRTKKTESSNGKTQIRSRKNKNSKKLHLPQQSPEFGCSSMARTFANDSDFEKTARKSSKIESVGGSQLVEAAPKAQCAHSANVKTVPQNESSNNRIEHLNSCTTNEVDKSSDKAELPPFFSYGDYWSDPCFEFAFKTLTGAIPVEDNLSVQSYFQQQVDTPQTQREGCFQQIADTSQAPRDGSLALPDFGLPSFFQTDISVHFDTPDKQLATQPQVSSSNSSFMPSGTGSLPSCSGVGIGSQQPMHLKENKGLRGKVNS